MVTNDEKTMMADLKVLSLNLPEKNEKKRKTLQSGQPVI
jgi:hypothetical protein